jgi:hypothetical protein
MSNFEKKIEKVIKSLLLPKFPFIKDFKLEKDENELYSSWVIKLYCDYDEMNKYETYLTNLMGKVREEMFKIQRNILNLRLHQIMVNFVNIKNKPENTIEEQYDNVKTPPAKLVRRVLTQLLKELFPEIMHIRVEESDGGKLDIFVIVDGTEDEFESELYLETLKIMKGYFDFKNYTIQVFVEGEEDLPFDEKIEEGYRERTFNESLDEMDLKWHWDEQDRLVSPTHKTDWMFQFDNELPIRLKEGEEIFIPKGRYHRVIKGTGDLKVKVKFL